MYLITGGAGFIGSNIAAVLADRGDDVVISDWLGSDERWRNLAKHTYMDIVAPPALKSWLEENGSALSAVIHMGAISATTETNIDALLESNIRLSLDLWDFCARKEVALIYASSAATYGDGRQGFDDQQDEKTLSTLAPLNAYGWSKHFVDRRISRLLAQGAPKPPQWIGLKFFNVYGPNEYHKGGMKSVIAQNFAKVRAGETLRLFRSRHPGYVDGGQLRDFIYVKDCVNVILWLLSRPEISGLFNLGTGVARSWLDLAHGLFAALGLEPNIAFIDMPQNIQEKYQYFTQARMDRLRRAGYDTPFLGLERGIREYVQHYLDTGDPYA